MHIAHSQRCVRSAGLRGRREFLVCLLQLESLFRRGLEALPSHQKPTYYRAVRMSPTPNSVASTALRGRAHDGGGGGAHLAALGEDPESSGAVAVDTALWEPEPDVLVEPPSKRARRGADDVVSAESESVASVLPDDEKAEAQDVSEHEVLPDGWVGQPLISVPSSLSLPTRVGLPGPVASVDSAADQSCDAISGPAPLRAGQRLIVQGCTVAVEQHGVAGARGSYLRLRVRCPLAGECGHGRCSKARNVSTLSTAACGEFEPLGYLAVWVASAGRFASKEDHMVFVPSGEAIRAYLREVGYLPVGVPEA